MPYAKGRTNYMADNNMIDVEVAYALAHDQRIVALQVAEGTTAREAAAESGIADLFEGLDINSSDMGVFGKSVKPDQHIMQPGQRVEIYRPLIIDPKEVRKNRAEKAKKDKAK